MALLEFEEQTLVAIKSEWKITFVHGERIGVDGEEVGVKRGSGGQATLPRG